MKRPLLAGAEPLDDAGLIALTPCGHWWVYPCHASIQQMHDLARFNLGIACTFCLAEWEHASSLRPESTALRVN